MQPSRALHHTMQVPEGLLRVLQGDHLLVTAAGARLGPRLASLPKAPASRLAACLVTATRRRSSPALPGL